MADGRALQGFITYQCPDRPADLSVLRISQRLWHDFQRVDPRRVWRRDHERDRFHDEYDAGGGSQGRSRQNHHVREVSAVQDLLGALTNFASLPSCSPEKSWDSPIIKSKVRRNTCL